MELFGNPNWKPPAQACDCAMSAKTKTRTCERQPIKLSWKGYIGPISYGEFSKWANLVSGSTALTWNCWMEIFAGTERRSLRPCQRDLSNFRLDVFKKLLRLSLKFCLRTKDAAGVSILSWFPNRTAIGCPGICLEQARCLNRRVTPLQRQKNGSAASVNLLEIVCEVFVDVFLLLLLIFLFWRLKSLMPSLLFLSPPQERKRGPVLCPWRIFVAMSCQKYVDDLGRLQLEMLQFCWISLEHSNIEIWNQDGTLQLWLHSDHFSSGRRRVVCRS